MSHQQQAEFCESVRARFPKFFRNRRVLDCGALDINGSNRPLFVDSEYIGVDLGPGRNVDLVCHTHELDLPEESFDVVVSTECFEHDRHYAESLQKIVSLLKPGGLFFFTCASTGRAEHGTLRTHAGDSPFTSAEPGWENYYRNLEEYDVRQALDVEEIFSEHAFNYNPTSHDLYFWGIKKGGKVVSAPIFMEDFLDRPLREVLPLLQERFVERTTYFGVTAIKNPLDAWVYQELIYRTRPDVIVEIGTRCGGGTLMLAHLCDAIGHGRVLGIDVDHSRVPDIVIEHPRIRLVKGDACASYDEVRSMIEAHERVLVIEDSSHTFENTLNVLRTFSGLVRPGGYFIVEDGICHHGLDVGPDPGPYEAIEAFVAENSEFVVDRELENFVITWNPKGFLRRQLDEVSTVKLGIPTYCRYDLLDQLLLSAERGTVRPAGYIIIDNGNAYPRERLNALLGERAVVAELISPGTNIGVAAAWNRILEMTLDDGGVIISNDDIELGPKTFEELSTALGIHPFVEGDGWALFGQTVGVTEDVGYYDENFWPAYYEDVDYEERMRRRGIVPFNPLSVPAKHHGWATTTAVGNAAWLAEGRARNHAYFLSKWGGESRSPRWNGTLEIPQYASPFDGKPPEGWCLRGVEGRDRRPPA